jgi:hypothetical protein
MNESGKIELEQWMKRASSATGCAAMLLLVLCIGTGCKTPPLHDRVIGQSYEPENIYLYEDFLPGDLKRIALLPVTVFRQESAMDAGRETLEPVFQAEFGKARMFELVAVSREDLRRWTGRAEWRSNDALPDDFLDRLTEATGCDAVLFIELTAYQAYPPLRVGWRCKLVDAFTGHIWWAADEVFDAGNPLVINAARRYYQQQMLPTAPALMDSRSILHSPRRFSQYTASALAGTLPGR